MQDEVFFIGSGFSKAINSKYPTLLELSNQILGINYEKIQDEYNTSYFPASCKNNIEILLTYLSSNFPWKTKEQDLKDRALYEHIVSKIQQIFGYLSSQESPNNNDNSEKFIPLWKYIMQKGTPIISLNYDLLCEIYLSLQKCPRLKGYVKNYNEFANFYRGRIINIESTIDLMDAADYLPEIIKLHGSCNWYYSGDNLYSKIYFGDNSDPIPKEILGSYSPYIVPPITDKNIFYKNQTIKYLWNRAFHYLKKAKKIYIIGFSFPQTDLSVKLLFESAMKQNTDVCVYVINTAEALNIENSNYIIERYNEIFANTNINYDYCCDNSLELFTKNFLLKQEDTNAK